MEEYIEDEDYYEYEDDEFLDLKEDLEFLDEHLIENYTKVTKFCEKNNLNLFKNKNAFSLFKNDFYKNHNISKIEEF